MQHQSKSGMLQYYGVYDKVLTLIHLDGPQSQTEYSNHFKLGKTN